MTTRDDIVKKAFAQFDVLMNKRLEIIDKRFKELDVPEPPKRKGKRAAPVVRTPFDGAL